MPKMRTIYYGGVMIALGALVFSVIGGKINTMMTLDNRSGASNQGSAHPPQGSLDLGGNSCSLSGYAVDLDAPDQSLKIHVYLDKPFDADLAQSGVYLGEYASDRIRSDVNQMFKVGGSYGFTIDLATNSQMPNDGRTHQAYVYAIDANGGTQSTQLVNSPKAVRCR